MLAYVTEITDVNFEEFINQDGINIIDIYGVWCGPCKVLSPIVDQLAIEFTSEGKNVKIGKMDVDNTRDKAVELGITSIPTILIYKDGVVVDRSVGMIQKPILKQKIENYF